MHRLKEILREIKHIWYETIGFDNFHDIVTSTFGVKGNAMLPIVGVGLSLIANLITSFIETYLFVPALGVVLLFLFTIADIFVGASLAIKTRTFNGWRLVRAMVRFMFQMFILFAAFNMAKVFPLFVYKIMVDSLLFIFSISVLWSTIKNAYKLRWITPQVYYALESVFNADKLIRKIIDKFQGGKPPDKDNSDEKK